MKRHIISGLFLLMLGFSPAGAQVYDDIYYTPADAQKEAAQQAKAAARDSARYAQEQGSSQQAQSGGYYRGDEYIDYDNDYYYATNINRFNRPFYNLSFYSGFYNPFWYDPFWVDPYWGWSPWVRPGISISIGGPYWSSFGGWYDWYGYPGFYSAWSYPYYAGGWGGYGWYGYNAGYYSGYWNGYYAGLYNGHYGYRTATYGPRYTLNTIQNSNIRNVGSNVRGFRSNAINVAENPRLLNTTERNARGSATRPGAAENTRVQPGVRNNDIRRNEESNNNIQVPDRNIRSNDRNIRDNNIRNNDIRTAPERPQPGRFEVQPAPGRTITPQANPQGGRNIQTPRYQPQVQPAAPVRQAPVRQEPVRTQPAPMRQAPSRSYEAPSRNYSAPSAPSRNYSAPSAPARSSGGGGGGYRR